MLLPHYDFSGDLFDRALRQIEAYRISCGIPTPLPESVTADRTWNREAWYLSWSAAADGVRREAGSAMMADRNEEAWQGYLLASLCYHAAGLFLDRRPIDPRCTLGRESSAACFRMAIKLFPSEAASLSTDGTRILFSMRNPSAPRLSILGDSPIERYAALVVPALRWGYACELPLATGCECPEPSNGERPKLRVVLSSDDRLRRSLSLGTTLYCPFFKSRRSWTESEEDSERSDAPNRLLEHLEYLLAE
jgi:hypothetical protein